MSEETKKKLTVRDLDAEKKYRLVVRCRECGEKLNETLTMTGEEMRKAWVRLWASQPLVTGSCPKGCRATFSDCNLNTRDEIEEVADDESH
jgi:hypothetical protein